MAAVQRKNDKGLITILDELGDAHGKRIEVGVFRGATAKRSAEPGSKHNSLAYRYRAHDEGRGVPKRETLRPAMEKGLNDKFVQEFLSKDLDKGGLNKRAARAGVRLVGYVKKEITDLRVPPKAESTILAAQKRYGGGRRDNPLIQTGEMRAAVSSRYVK